MTERRKHGLYLLLIAIPIGAYGALNFQIGGASGTASAIGIAISSTFGLTFIVGGLVMLVTKKSLGIWNPDDKGRGEDLLASQTKVGDSPILDKEKIEEQNTKALDEVVLKTTDHVIKSLTKGGKPMAKVNKRTQSSDYVRRFRALGEIGKNVTTERAEIRATLKKRGVAIDENGTIEIIELAE